MALIPFKRTEETEVPAKVELPLFSFQKEMNRLFDNFWTDLGTTPTYMRGLAFSPSLDITEDDKQYHLICEIPGMDPKEIQVSVNEDVITIKGEKKEDREEKNESYSSCERSFGSFYRSIPFSTKIDQERIKANYKHGVLHLWIPKTASVSTRTRMIPIST